MKLLGENIAFVEAKIDEEYLLLAEEIIENAGCNDYRQKSKYEHYLSIEDRGFRYDTRLEIRGETLKDGYCNCVTFSKNKLCGHITASILFVRQKLSEAAEIAREKAIASSLRKHTKRTSMDAIVNHVNPNDLRSFVLSYARQDSLFKLLFQAHFFELLSDQQVEILLEASFPPLTKSNEKVTPKRISNFIKIADTLLTHFKSLIAKEDLIAAYDLNFRLLQKSFYIKYNLAQFNEKLIQYHTIFLENYMESIRLVEAPEYKSHIYSELMKLLSTSYISAGLKQERDLWISAISHKEYNEELKENAKKLASRPPRNDMNTVYFARFIRMILSNEHDRKEQIKHLDPQESYRIIQIAAEFDKLEQSQLILRECLLLKDLNLPVTKIVLQYIIGDTDEALVNRIIHYFMLYRDLTFLSFLASNSKDWSHYKSVIENKLIAADNMDSLIIFYLFIEDKEKAHEQMMRLNSLTEVEKYDQAMALFDTTLLYHVYQSLADKFLKDHFGLLAQQFVTELYQRLEKIGLPKLRRKLEDYIIITYKDRASLN